MDFTVTPPRPISLRSPLLRLLTRIGALASLPVVVCASDAAEAPPSSPTIVVPHRLYDATPTSPANPAIASIKEYGIEIPLSEFRAYVRSDTPGPKIGQELTNEEKRVEIQKLIDEHLWVWVGFAQHADLKDPDIRGMLTVTEHEALRTLLIRDEVESKAKSFPEYQLLRRAFIQRLFDQAEIHVSSSAYELLKPAAKKINAAEAALKPTQEIDPDNLPDGLTQPQRLQPLATSKVGTIRIADLLSIYDKTPVRERLDLDKPEHLTALLRDAFEGALLLAEARARGLDRNPAVLQQVENDRTGLVRQWAMEEITRRADVAVHRPDSEPKIKAWYDSHRADYTAKGADGKFHVIDYAEAHDQAMGDYFTHLMLAMRREQLDAYRKGRSLVVDNERLDQATIRWLEAPMRMEMRADKITWDSDTREYVAKPGETQTSFTFSLQNVSDDYLTIDDVHPVNEYVVFNGPPLPWRLAPKQYAQIKVDVDLRSKVGAGRTSIEVLSSVGTKTLTLKITYPPRPLAEQSAAPKNESM